MSTNSPVYCLCTANHANKMLVVTMRSTPTFNAANPSSANVLKDLGLGMTERRLFANLCFTEHLVPIASDAKVRPRAFSAVSTGSRVTKVNAFATKTSTTYKADASTATWEDRASRTRLVLILCTPAAASEMISECINGTVPD